MGEDQEVMPVPFDAEERDYIAQRAKEYGCTEAEIVRGTIRALMGAELNPIIDFSDPAVQAHLAEMNDVLSDMVWKEDLPAQNHSEQS